MRGRQGVRGLVQVSRSVSTRSERETGSEGTCVSKQICEYRR